MTQALPVVPPHVHQRYPWLGPAVSTGAGRARDYTVLVLASAVTLLFAQHKASLKRLTEMPLTVLGTGAIDFAGFHLAHGWGWLLLGVSLLIVERMISDSPDDSRRA
jgi:hypothetical protein